MTKFTLTCTECGQPHADIGRAIRETFTCRSCGSGFMKFRYPDHARRIRALFEGCRGQPGTIWKYADLLPIERKSSILTAGEGDVAVHRWPGLEHVALRFGVDCRVYAHRNDNNNATGSFKDLAGSVVASALNEHGVREYAVASTGNVGVAFARYISDFQGVLYVFIPRDSADFKAAEISMFGQKVFRVDGFYEDAKRAAKAFSAARGIPLSDGMLDPLRIEAKKTMAYKWYDLLNDFPTVYVQALSGGTGPLGIVKGCRELREAGLITDEPRLLLVQSDRCAPMHSSYQRAREKGFPDGWQKDYQVLDAPCSSIPTLATGHPKLYPLLAEQVRAKDGDILAFPETAAETVARYVAFHYSVRIGPAAAVGIGGFFLGLASGNLRNGDVVVVNIGEGARRDPEFMIRLNRTEQSIATDEVPGTFDRLGYGLELEREMFQSLGIEPPMTERL